MYVFDLLERKSGLLEKLKRSVIITGKVMKNFLNKKEKPRKKVPRLNYNTKVGRSEELGRKWKMDILFV